MAVDKANNELLRRLEFTARAQMEKEARKLNREIIKVYTEAQLNIQRKIQQFQNSITSGGIKLNSRASQARLRLLKDYIDTTLIDLGNTVEGVVHKAQDLGIEKAKTISMASNKILKTDGPEWATFMARDVEAYLKNGLLLKKFSSSVETYSDLVKFFKRQDTAYYSSLLKGLRLEQEILINLKWGTLKEIAASVAEFKKLGIAWKPLAEIERLVKTAAVERISYRELVTRLRRDAWRLKPYARAPNVTYQATRLARTEMMRSAALANNAWGYETPGIYGIRRWFGGGACDGSCLQYVGYWSYGGNQPMAIPVHPHCACYDTYEVEPRPKQHRQQVLLMDNRSYMDSMTYQHNLVIANRANRDLPGISRRYWLSGSNRFGDPFLRPNGNLDRNRMLTHLTESRLRLIN